MVRALLCSNDEDQGLRAANHLIVYDDFNDTENTALLTCIKDALFSWNRIFSYALEAQNSNTVNFRFVNENQ
jgi:hypothetical protein